MSFITWTLEKTLNNIPFIKKFGTLHLTSLDVELKTLSGEAELLGEVLPLPFSIRYRQEDNDMLIISAHVEREWIQQACNSWFETHGPFRLSLKNKWIAGIARLLF